MITLSVGVIGLSTVIVGTWLLELLLTPKPRAPLQRNWWANLIHVLTLSGLWAVLLAITARPGLSAALTLSLALLIVLVNQDKQRQLREPFLACDFVYFWDVVRHPKLYLPFFGYGKAAGLLTAFLLTLVLWLWLEPAALSGLQTKAFALLLGLGLCGLAYGFARVMLARGLTLEPTTDLTELGLVAVLVAQKAAGPLWLNDNAQKTSALAAPWIKLESSLDAEPKPDIICIQAESFFDARRHYPQKTPLDVFEPWDQARELSWRFGSLSVPAWGANTVRSEFSFLAGMPGQALGVHQYQPYALVKRTPAALWQHALPARLKTLGFYCSFMHPYVASFYDRDRVLPKLGFDEFIDIQAMGSWSRQRGRDHSSYLPDPVLGQSILQRLDEHQSDQPLFMHVVTMQGHGPYDGQGKDPQSLFEGYMHCMRSTNEMIGDLLRGIRLSVRQRPTVLCVFGDHVPILPSVYSAWGYPSGSTDYLIWRSWDRVAGCGVKQDLDLQNLGLLVANASNLTSTRHD